MAFASPFSFHLPQAVLLQAVLLVGIGVLGLTNPSAALPPEIDAVLDSRLKNRNLGPIYKPDLPPDRYIDKTQEQLSKTAKPFETYIRFVEPTDKDVSAFQVRNYAVKKWTELERNDVHRILQHIFLTAPGLIMRAASGAQLALVRTATINRPENMSTDLRHSDSMAASAGPLSINFADEFFLSPHQCHGLVHELVHAADYTGKVSYSKEWMDFAQPIISKIRIKLNFLSAFEKRELAVHMMRGGGEWVSLYGCENMMEALAEYTSTYIDDRERVDTNFEHEFANRLLVPSPQDLDSGRHFKLGYNALDRKQYDEAIMEFTKSIDIDPNVGIPHARLAIALAKKSQNAKALLECETAEVCFDKAGIPLEDNELNYLLQWKATVAYRKGDYAVSIATLNKLLRNQPPTPDSYYARFAAEDQLAQTFAHHSLIGSATVDLYEWHNLLMHSKDDFSDFINSGNSDPKYTMKLLDADVERFPALGLPLTRRARFLETLGDAQKDSDIKMEFYSRALEDFRNTIDKSDCDRNRANFECGIVCYKLKLTDKIQQYLHEIADDGIDEKSVLQILYWESLDNNFKARQLYQEFKGKIFNGGKMHLVKPWDYITNVSVPFNIIV
jgi:tetratricopeptide (TPR) repeat protein